MRQRLSLAQALLGNPKLLILDEPTNGLDPGAISELRETLRRLVSDRGLTIFLSTHLLSEADQLCSRVAILVSGRVRAEGTIADLTRPGMMTWEYRVVDTDRAIAALSRAVDIRFSRGLDDRLTLSG